MKKLILATALLALATGFASAQTIRLGTEGAYPPYNFINDKGEIDGFEKELGDELCKRASLTCEFVQNDWDSIIPNLQSGNYDVIIAGMSITEEREKIINFSQNYYPPAASAYVGKTADVDVTKGVISAQVSTIQSAAVAASGATLLEFATPDETIAAVRNGEADAVFADKDYLAPFVADSNGELMFVGEDVALGGGVGLGMRESDTELKGKFDAAIQSMKDDGTLNTLITKWFGETGATF
ncbi:MAG: transporter substrate-binding domain-containing protein [Paracoccaceae bacterium]